MHKKKLLMLFFLLLICLIIVVFEKYTELSKTEKEDIPKESINKEEKTTQEETETFPTLTKEQVQAYSNDIVTWGPGIQKGEDGRPIAPVAFEQKYTSFQAEFIKENEKKIYLTFDEGYENGYTQKILDTLKEKNVSAVFFVTMPYAKEQQELIKRMIAENHVVGHHSVSHPADGMPSLSIDEQVKEYQELHEYILNTYGYEMYLFRPPAGIFSEQSLAVAQMCHYRTILWSFAYADWDPNKQPEHQAALSKLKERLHQGAIYLLHAVSSTNAEILGEFIDYARAEGYEFCKYE